MITEMAKCPQCNKEIPAEANFCGKCGFGLHECPLPRLPKTSVLALTAFVFGSLVASPYFIFASVPALLFGIASSIRIRRNPSRLFGKGFAYTGIVLGGFGTLILALWLPVYMEIRVHDRSVKAKMDMRNIAEALETYKIDKNVLPSNLNILASPLDYLSYIPSDPFNRSHELSYFHFKDSSSNENYFIWSVGPDTKMDLTPQILRTFSADWSKSMPLFMGKTYDVTNGMYSSGDIWRMNDELRPIIYPPSK